jgi:hypothetical protein
MKRVSSKVSIYFGYHEERKKVEVEKKENLSREKKKKKKVVGRTRRVSSKALIYHEERKKVEFSSLSSFLTFLPFLRQGDGVFVSY